jgi:hypothetical protein
MHYHWSINQKLKIKRKTNTWIKYFPLFPSPSICPHPIQVRTVQYETDLANWAAIDVLIYTGEEFPRAALGWCPLSLFLIPPHPWIISRVVYTHIVSVNIESVLIFDGLFVDVPQPPSGSETTPGIGRPRSRKKSWQEVYINNLIKSNNNTSTQIQSFAFWLEAARWPGFLKHGGRCFYGCSFYGCSSALK